MDWSADSAFLQSNCAGYEIVYWDAENGKYLPTGASQLRNVDWETWSCVLGWPVQGIFEKGSDGRDIGINMVDRSHEKFYGEYHGIAAVDNCKRLNIYKYPCLKMGSGRLVGIGHGSAVTNVKWNEGDNYIVTTGGEDQCVMLWSVQKPL